MTLAECILPGHPDKVCDRVADALVDAACARHPRALVGVEVAIHRDRVFVTGCIATRPALTMDDVIELVRNSVAASGYSAAWTPDPAKLRVDGDLRLDDLDEELSLLRVQSDDQAICVGYAVHTPAENCLPRAHRLAWVAARRLAEIAPAADLGPDGKVIVAVENDVVSRLSLSLHHRPRVDRVGLFRVGQAVAAAIGVDDPGRVEVNGGGDFDVGGPWGDNGLSGKKLVVDAYGPTVPVGGGAWSGKDPHKVDRVGALRARQLALRALRLGLGHEATVSLGWFPGDRSPSVVHLRVDGHVVEWARLGRVDLSIEATHAELGLDRVRWAHRAATASWFQVPGPWG